MRNFIKTHPWRLEVVPALTVLWCLLAVIYYYLRLAGRLESLIQSSHRTLGAILIIVTLMASCHWALEMTINHKWALSERRKRFNYMALLLQVPILVEGWLAFLLLGLFRWVTTRSAPIETPWLGSSAIFVAGLCVTTVFEATRAYVPREFTELPSPSGMIGDDDYFLYQEIHMDWSTLFISAFAIAACSVLAVSVHNFWMFAIGFFATGLLFWMGYRKVMVTPAQIQSIVGPFRKRVHMSDITDWRESFHEYLGKLPPGARRSGHIGFGPCVEVTTRDGEVHILGMSRPSFMCTLIESAKGKFERE